METSQMLEELLVNGIILRVSGITDLDKLQFTIQIKDCWHTQHIIGFTIVSTVSFQDCCSNAYQFIKSKIQATNTTWKWIDAPSKNFARNN